MKMSYETNSRLPRIRMEAARMVQSGATTRETARHFGYAQGTIVKWTQRACEYPSNAHVIPTKSSRPHHHPKELSPEIVEAVIAYREKHRRCAEVIHHLLERDGISLSLSSVKRIFRRYGMTRYSKWKKWHTYPPRPVPEAPGVLTEIDTVHMERGSLYVYTFIDVMSRYGVAIPVPVITGRRSISFVERIGMTVPFPVQTIQSDHGPEFGKWFTKQIIHLGYAHRHSRVRTPTDNGHIERFNRTIQEECFSRIPRTLKAYRKEIPEYLSWYNTKRPHLALKMQSPIDIVQRSNRFQGIE